MKNKIRTEWFKRQVKGIVINKDDTIFEISRDMADLTKPIYVLNNKLYLIVTSTGGQV